MAGHVRFQQSKTARFTRARVRRALPRAGMTVSSTPIAQAIRTSIVTGVSVPRNPAMGRRAWSRRSVHLVSASVVCAASQLVTVHVLEQVQRGHASILSLKCCFEQDFCCSFSSCKGHPRPIAFRIIIHNCTGAARQHEEEQLFFR